MNIRYDKSIRVKTDPDLLLRIIENLFINSLEAGAAKIDVEIKYLPDDGLSAIELVDNGSGLPPELFPDAIFEPFMTTKPKGSGIGLWQVKQLVSSLGGKITAKNEEIGGARFIITLPTDKCLYKINSIFFSESDIFQQEDR